MNSDLEDRLAYMRHGIQSESECDSSSDGKSDFDDEHEAHKPPPISMEDREHDIVKVGAFETVVYKKHSAKKIQSKLYGNKNKPKCTSSKIRKQNKQRCKTESKVSENSQKDGRRKLSDSIKCINTSNKIKEHNERSSSFSSNIRNCALTCNSKEGQDSTQSLTQPQPSCSRDIITYAMVAKTPFSPKLSNSVNDSSAVASADKKVKKKKRRKRKEVNSICKVNKNMDENQTDPYLESHLKDSFDKSHYTQSLQDISKLNSTSSKSCNLPSTAKNKEVKVSYSLLDNRIQLNKNYKSLESLERNKLVTDYQSLPEPTKYKPKKHIEKIKKTEQTNSTGNDNGGLPRHAKNKSTEAIMKKPEQANLVNKNTKNSYWHEKLMLLKAAKNKSKENIKTKTEQTDLVNGSSACFENQCVLESNKSKPKQYEKIKKKIEQANLNNGNTGCVDNRFQQRSVDLPVSVNSESKVLKSSAGHNNMVKNKTPYVLSDFTTKKINKHTNTKKEEEKELIGIGTCNNWNQTPQKPLSLINADQAVITENQNISNLPTNKPKKQRKAKKKNNLIGGNSSSNQSTQEHANYKDKILESSSNTVVDYIVNQSKSSPSVTNNQDLPNLTTKKTSHPRRAKNKIKERDTIVNFNISSQQRLLEALRIPMELLDPQTSVTGTQDTSTLTISKVEHRSAKKEMEEYCIDFGTNSEHLIPNDPLQVSKHFNCENAIDESSSTYMSESNCEKPKCRRRKKNKTDKLISVDADSNVNCSLQKPLENSIHGTDKLINLNQPLSSVAWDQDPFNPEVKHKCPRRSKEKNLSNKLNHEELFVDSHNQPDSLTKSTDNLIHVEIDEDKIIDVTEPTKENSSDKLNPEDLHFVDDHNQFDILKKLTDNFIHVDEVEPTKKFSMLQTVCGRNIHDKYLEEHEFKKFECLISDKKESNKKSGAASSSRDNSIPRHISNNAIIETSGSIFCAPFSRSKISEAELIGWEWQEENVNKLKNPLELQNNCLVISNSSTNKKYSKCTPISHKGDIFNSDVELQQHEVANELYLDNNDSCITSQTPIWSCFTNFINYGIKIVNAIFCTTKIDRKDSLNKCYLSTTPEFYSCGNRVTPLHLFDVDADFKLYEQNCAIVNEVQLHPILFYFIIMAMRKLDNR